MTTENQYNGILEERVFAVDAGSWLRTRRAKALKSRFDDLHNEWLSFEPVLLVARAWWIYLVQIIRDAVFESGSSMHVDWVPENFSKLPFDKEEGGRIFEDFLKWFDGECAGDVYAMDENTAEAVQAGMHEVAKDWFAGKKGIEGGEKKE